MKKPRSPIRRPDFMVPIFLALFFWVSITYILFSGEPGRSLAEQGEQAFIDVTLSRTHWRAGEKNVIRVVGPSKRDVRYSGAEQIFPLFQSILRRSVESKPRAIYIEWGRYYLVDGRQELLASVLAELPQDMDIYLMIDLADVHFLSRELSSAVKVLLMDNCGGQSFVGCSIEESDSRSALRAITQNFWPQLQKSPSFHISRNLPYPRQAILLNLPDWDSIVQLDFSQVEAFSISSEDILFFKVPGFLPPPGLIKIPDDRYQAGYINLSRFFGMALVAAMFSENNTVGIPPHAVTITLMICLCGIIIILLWKAGRPAAFGIFLLYSFVYPIANRYGIDSFHVYIPMFDFVYAGLVTFLVAAYVQLSLEAFKRWRIDVREPIIAKSGLLKSNFISLISHDLNTPVAKMSGLADVLIMKNKNSELDSDLLFIQQGISRLLVAVRAVLMAARIDARAFRERSLSLIGLRGEFEDRILPILKKLDYDCYFTLIDENFEENRQPFVIDERVVCYGVLALIALYKGGISRKFNLSAGLKVLERGSNESVKMMLTFTLFAQASKLSPEVKGLLFSKLAAKFDMRAVGFYEEVLVHLIQLLVEHLNGSLSITESSEGERIAMKFFF